MKEKGDQQRSLNREYKGKVRMYPEAQTMGGEKEIR